MRFWDSSALIALVVSEPSTKTCRRLFDEDRNMIVWSITEMEIASGLHRRERSGDLSSETRVEAQRRVDTLISAALNVASTAPVMMRARRVLALHPLRAGDALQLAAALIACDEQPHLLSFVTLDARLGEAATREGFAVLPNSRSLHFTGTKR